MKKVIWAFGTILILSFLVMNWVMVLPALYRFLNPLLLAAFFCLFRIAFGPTSADRAVAIDILGILIISFCGLFAIFLKRDFFIDIAMAWALQSFIGTIALAKYLEGRSFDE